MVERLRKVGFARLKPVDEVLENLLSQIERKEKERILTNKSLNRILYEDVQSKINVPHFRRAAMDGYAVKAKNTFEASPKNPKYLKLVGQIDIGEIKDLELREGEAIRISTGAAVPKGADSVIKIEDTKLDGENITIYTSVAPGKNVGKKGEDIKKESTVLSGGVQIKAEHIALLSSLGMETITVSKKPQISLFATGDELLEVGESVSENKIFDSNTPMIHSLVEQYGGKVIKTSLLKDDKKLITAALSSATKESDIVIFTGGTSVGTKDFLPEILNKKGEILAHGVAMRPGSPLLVALYNECLVFCLPGTPVAAYVGFLKIVGKSIRQFLRCQHLDPRIEISALISKDVPVTKLGYLYYLRAKLIKSEENFLAQPVRLKGSGILSSLTESDGIIEISPDQEGLKRGDKVIIKLHPQ
ncbi:MAG: molybdopterin molybdotransferase MoeA [Promethearchaeia archaeon]